MMLSIDWFAVAFYIIAGVCVVLAFWLFTKSLE